MTEANDKRADGSRARPPETRLEETFVLLDNSAGLGAPTLLFSAPKGIVSAWMPDEVGPALAAIESGSSGPSVKW